MIDPMQQAAYQQMQQMQAARTANMMRLAKPVMPAGGPGVMPAPTAAPFSPVGLAPGVGESDRAIY